MFWCGRLRWACVVVRGDKRQREVISRDKVKAQFSHGAFVSLAFPLAPVLVDVCAGEPGETLGALAEVFPTDYCTRKGWDLFHFFWDGGSA